MRARDLRVYFVLTAAALGLGCGGCIADDESVPATEVVPCVGADCPAEGTNNGFDEDVGGDIRNICEGGECECNIGPEGGFCRTQYCGVVIEPNVLSDPEVIALRESTEGRFAGRDLLGDRVCELAPLQNKPNGPLQVSVTYDVEDIPAGFIEEEILGVHVTPQFTLAADSILDRERNRVSFTITRGGVQVGATVLPVEERVADVIGLPLFDVNDAETYLLNISRNNFGAVFFDGQRFYAANGPRVFIWNDGVPVNPLAPPDVILGRSSLEEMFQMPSASSFSGTANAIWSDGERLVVAEGHRVLIWSKIPTESFAPADLVLGQDDFHAFSSNSGEGAVNDAGFSSPQGVWSDGERLIVADSLNHRFLVWNSFPRIIGQKADSVIGQPAFDTAVPGEGQINAYQAWSAYFDGSRLALASRFACECFHVVDGFPSSGNPAAAYTVGLGYPLNSVGPETFGGGTALTRFGASGVAFLNGARVSAWFDFPDGSRPADITLGKPDDTIGGVLGAISASSFASQTPYGDVFSDENHLFVGDGHRLLIWNEVPQTDFEAADVVIGQPGFGTEIAGVDYRGIGRKSVAQPTSVSSAGNVTVIADRANNRVIVLRSEDPFTSETLMILGQPDGASYLPNRGIGAATAATMQSPSSVFTDGERIAVADSGNHRVLLWHTLPTTDGAPADVVLGQTSFTGRAQNGGNLDGDGDGDFDADAASLHYPAGVHFDGSVFFVADQFNNRVLAWDGFPTSAGRAADGVIGQPDFAANDPNRGLGWFARDAGSLARPIDVDTTADGRILVSDAQNNRVLVFAGVDALSADAVIGQPDFVSDVSPEYYSGVNSGLPRPDHLKTAEADTLRVPGEIVWTGDSLIVADNGNHRALEFPGLEAGITATRVWGQPDFTTRAINEDTVSAESLKSPQGVTIGPNGGVIIADTGNHRLLRYNGDAVAHDLYGQTLFHENGINGASPALDSVRSPGGIALEPNTDQLWVTDAANHRVVLYEGSGQRLVIGQENLGGSTINGGELQPEAWTFAEPTDVWSDGTRLIVADRGNNRVLIWNEIPRAPTTPANVVLGQPDFHSAAANAGTETSAAEDTLFAPEGVFMSSQGALYVADTGNNRVLVWDEVPTANGAAADRVICQVDFAANLPNHGTGDASASSCAGPTDAVAAGDGIWIADSRNNRVLRFESYDSSTGGLSTGASATLVLGQADFTGRRPAAGNEHPSRVNLSNPVRVEFDGRNLYVVDRGHNRVLIWNPLPTHSYTPANRVLGQEAFDTAVASANTEGLSSPFGVAVQALDYNSARVWISDRDRDRVVVFDHVARSF